MFCQKCGNEINDGVQFCDKCGTPTNGAQPAYNYTAAPTQNLVASLASKVKINGIIWVIIGSIQLLAALVFCTDLDWYMTEAITFLIIGALNIANAVRDFKYSKTVIQSPIGIVEKFQPIGGAIVTLIYNVLFGGLIGIAGSIYYFIMRNFVMKNAEQFKAIEQSV